MGIAPRKKISVENDAEVRGKNECASQKDDRLRAIQLHHNYENFHFKLCYPYLKFLFIKKFVKGKRFWNKRSP